MSATSMNPTTRAQALQRLGTDELDLLVVGGGVSKASDKFLPKLNLKTPIVPAHLRNRAGIIGAAWLAVDKVENPDRPS